jgi:hypothetical protein
MAQHVISEWLLKSFARKGPSGSVLDAYDKVDDAYSEAPTKTFLTEIDAHSQEVENQIGRIESPASRAAQQFAKIVKPLPAGIYAVMGEGATTKSSGAQLRDGGILAGVRIHVTEHEVASPSQADRLALGTFIGLMYQRSPQTERAMIRYGQAYEAAAQEALNGLLPGVRHGLETVLAGRRTRMLGLAKDIGSQLADANWWVVRAGPDEGFVLGDSPAVATIALGDHGEWRAILAPDAFVVTTPLGPTFAPLIAPQRIFAVTEAVDREGITRVINQLIWTRADRYVTAHARSTLDHVWADPQDDLRRVTVPPSFATEEAVRVAARDVTRIVRDAGWRQDMQRWIKSVPWRHWRGCRLRFGWQPVAAEDRPLLFGPHRHLPAAGTTEPG